MREPWPHPLDEHERPWMDSIEPVALMLAGIALAITLWPYARWLVSRM